MSALKAALFFVAGLAIAFYFMNENSEKKVTEAASAYRTVVIEKLIEVKGDSTGGVTPTNWSKQTKETSIAIDKLKVLGKISDDEIESLEQIIRNMSATLTLWRISGCYNRISDSCLSEISETLYHSDFLITARKGDERAYLRKGNATLDEYNLVFKPYLLNNDIQSGSDLVSVYLTKTSNSIDGYLDIYAK
jgi:hypothetical protein